MVDLIASQRVERRRPLAAYRRGSSGAGQIQQRPARRRRFRGKTAGPGVSAARFFDRAFRGLMATGRRGPDGPETPPRRSIPVFWRRTDLPETPKENAGPRPKSLPASGGDTAAGAAPEQRKQALRTLLWSALPLILLIALGLGFFFLASRPLPAELSGLDTGAISRDDPRLLRDMTAYAGLLEEVREEAGEEIPLDLMESFAWQTYTVRRGDSVYKIAREHGLSMDAVIAGNGLTNARRLYQGQSIRLPNMDGIPYTVRRGDNLNRISAAMGVPLSAILDANNLESEVINPGMVLFIPGARMRTEDLKLALGELFINPVRGRLTSGFGWRTDPINGLRRYHAALDLAAPLGTPIRAAMDGRVATVGNNASYGRFIILIHDGGYKTLYAHLSAVSVRENAPVIQGAKIGEVGSTGYSTGPHLHFAVYKNDRAVNPLDFIQP